MKNNYRRLSISSLLLTALIACGSSQLNTVKPRNNAVTQALPTSTSKANPSALPEEPPQASRAQAKTVPTSALYASWSDGSYYVNTYWDGLYTVTGGGTKQ